MKIVRAFILLLLLVVSSTAQRDDDLAAIHRDIQAMSDLLDVRQEMINEYTAMTNEVLDKHPEVVDVVVPHLKRLTVLARKHDRILAKWVTEQK